LTAPSKGGDVRQVGSLVPVLSAASIALLGFALTLRGFTQI
jgi:hypothetical protein